MARLLDTDDLAPRDRAEAMAVAMQDARQPAVITYRSSGAGVHARLDLWELGGAVTLMRLENSALGLTRTPRQVRASEVERVGLTVLSPGTWRHAQHGDDRAERTDDWQLLLVDHATPYDFVRDGDSTTLAFAIDHDELGLSLDVVRAAATRVGGSPLERMMIDHVRGLADALPGVPPGAGALALGTATTELLRALVLTAAGAGEPQPSAASLLTRTRRYVDGHLTDPGLTPERIARAHHVSVRQLYSAWARNDVSLAGHIMTGRLELARRALRAPAARARTVAAVAHACGFVDPAHFSRRFRAAFGVSPREFRRVTDSGD